MKDYRKIEIPILYLHEEVLRALRQQENFSFMAHTHLTKYVEDRKEQFKKVKAVFFIPIGEEV